MAKVIDMMPDGGMKILPSLGPDVLPASTVLPRFREWNADPLMRKMGYNRNPDVCLHTVKGFTPRDGWWCKECGEKL